MTIENDIAQFKKVNGIIDVDTDIDKFAEIIIEWDCDNGMHIAAHWQGEQEYARITENHFWQFYTKDIDEDGLYVGLLVDFYGQLVRLVEFNTNNLYWIVKRAGNGSSDLSRQ